MAVQIDDQFLQTVGLNNVPDSEKQALLDQIKETLELRVGMRIADKMSEQQLKEFEKLIDAGDDTGALKWLQTNYPAYPQVVSEELGKLKQELTSDAPKILASLNQPK